jgi:hypothetical protein
VRSRYRTPRGPLLPTETASWPVGETRLVLVDRITLSVRKTGDDHYEVHHRAGVTGDRLEGKPSKPRERRPPKAVEPFAERVEVPQQ